MNLVLIICGIFAYVIQGTLCYPALKELPSITYDSLYAYETKKGDSDVAASSSDGINDLIVKKTPQIYSTLMKHMLRSGQDMLPTDFKFDHLTPFRAIKRLSTGVVGLGGTLTATVIKGLHDAGTTLKERVIPEASNLISSWSLPSKAAAAVVDNAGYSWMEGI